MPHVVTLETAATGAAIVVALSGREAMNALPSWTAEILLREPLSPGDLARKPATLRTVDEDEGTERARELVVTEVADEGRQLLQGHRYLVTLAPPFWLLSRRAAHRVFVDKTTKDIVDEVASAGGLRVVWRLAGTYMKRLQGVQSGETDWAFVSRLLAEEGIAYWFEDGDGGTALVLGDAKGAHEGIAGGPIPFRSVAGMVGRACFHELEVMRTMATDSVHVRDFDVRSPHVPFDGKAGKGPLEYFEFPADVLDQEAARRRADVRLEQLRRDALIALARGSTLRPRPGFLLEIEGASDDDGNGKFLVVEVEHDYRRPTPQDERSHAYTTRVRMARADAHTYRPGLPSGAPRIAELESVVTTGEPGQEIHVDDLGRVKIRWMWDRSGIGDHRSSAWVRCLQLGMGGSMLLPRVGWEVPVAYQYGKPDLPVVLGRLYNASLVVPYALPGAAMKTTLQSATSPGGGGTNELAMDDSAGKQKMFLHASKDMTVAVGGDAKIAIGNDELHDVGLGYGVTVKGAHTHTVAAAQKVSVGTEHQITVKGARSEAIAAMETIDVTANFAVQSKSSYVEGIAALHALECNQSNTDVKGAFTQAVGGSMNLTAGLGTSESVAAARSENVGGARLIVAKQYIENVRGAKNVTAGAASDKAGQKVVTFTQSNGTIHAASMNLEASGIVVIDAPNVTIDVSGALDAGALSLSGGTLKASKGTTKLKGTVKRQGETKVE